MSLTSSKSGNDLPERSQPGLPAWIEGHDVLVEHPLEKANRGRFVLEDQPVLGLVAAKYPEAAWCRPNLQVGRMNVQLRRDLERLLAAAVGEVNK